MRLLEFYGVRIEIDKAAARTRADELVGLGFGLADAAHVTFAEAADARFITCDDNLLKKCVKSATKVWCGNPVQFCTEEDLR